MTDFYKKALKLMAGHDMSKAPQAYAWLKAAMEDGSHRAAYAIGTWHLHGFFLEKDVKKAVTLITQAADNEVADAAFDLAVCYELGTGRKVNLNKALCYYMRSFFLGYAPAAVEIERLLYWGDASVRNRPLSREFKAAQHVRISPSAKKEMSKQAKPVD